ncbi:hypothetical protein ASPACDRAFT_1889025 [Aspergillus aculeatus ATCC 16872]|uniref:Alpha/beta hydrolase fold-3 domain-containing protein n=1 Tax=Aspergillus aculeatus (strain ATCC 16872 / CBS 172.66 / WB 5094) TaxID=690307 RepID=A0A1L9WTH8_ASPA1|nr:uncharacterized protein ASPACDRAFT_1889025 [Aspergillus aculeatus ATCC 16872]OJJ99463.1 hypothetical protein ASPACDRAFT_1889025 [Aspergillus aculeatus ATCC 16872]
MKPLTTLVLFFSFFGLLAAAPTDLAHFIDAATHFPFVDIPDQFPAMCSGTGSGYCNLGIASYMPSSGTKIRQAFVYDRYCRGLGARPFDTDAGKWSVYSLLPYTVELSITGGGRIPDGSFMYAGRKTDLGKMYCRRLQHLSLVNPRLKPFHHLQAPYKTFQDNNNTPQKIQTDILIPKTIPDPTNPNLKPLPLIVYFHGGGLICGSSLHLDWFPTYLLELAQTTPAVLITPNYRLLPEATIHEVFSDVLDFWHWVHSPAPVAALLAAVPSPQNASGPVTIDLARVLVAGGSAGGYLGLCLALRFPEQIGGVVVGYPAFLGVSSPAVASAAAAAAAAAGGAVSSSMRGEDEEGKSGLSNGDGDGVSPTPTATATAAPSPSPTTQPQTEEDLQEMHHLLNTALALAAQNRSPVRTFTTPPDRLDLMDAAMRTGRIAELFARGVDPAAHDPDRTLRYPMERLDDPVRIPRGGIAILHGREDEVVSVEDSVRFVGKAKEVLGSEGLAGKVVVTVREGGHGFDTPVGLGEGWLGESLRGVVGGG